MLNKFKAGNFSITVIILQFITEMVAALEDFKQANGYFDYGCWTQTTFTFLRGS